LTTEATSKGVAFFVLRDGGSAWYGVICNMLNFPLQTIFQFAAKPTKTLFLALLSAL